MAFKNKEVVIEKEEFVDKSGKNLKWGKLEYKEVYRTKSLIKAFFKMIKLKKSNDNIRLLLI